MGQQYVKGAFPLRSVIETKWERTQRNIIRLEIELGMRDPSDWPGPKIPPPPPRKTWR